MVVLVCEMLGCLGSGGKGVVDFGFLRKTVYLACPGGSLWGGYLFRSGGVL